MNQNEGRQQNWKQVAYFENDARTVAVTINFAEGFNYYSIQLGKPGMEKETLSKNIPVRMRGRGKIELSQNYGPDIAHLYEKAQLWALEHRQAIEDQSIETAQERESKRGIPAQVYRKTGKTERDRNKHKNQ